MLAAELAFGRLGRGELGGIASSIERSTIDLNPHQVKAAIFAIDAIERGGAILADEVGLGKTIEAGLVMRQLWSEGRRRILVLAPAPLRRQWQQELQTKFHLASAIRDARNLRQAERSGEAPWEPPAIVISSIPFAYNRRDEICEIPWDLVVIDEAHRLRGVARGSSKQARGLRDALEGRPKLLLTATPFQNDLLELFGLVSFVDPTLLGTDYSFQVRYVDGRGDDEAGECQDVLGDLRERLESVVNRTLRKEVSSYLQFTERHSALVQFNSSDAEEALRQDVTAYIASDDSVVFQGPRRALMSLVYHKLLASSSFALASSLDRLVASLERSKADAELLASFSPILEQFDGAFDEEEEEAGSGRGRAKKPNPAAIEREIALVQSLARRARAIQTSAKADALCLALERSFKNARSRNEPTKAVVFTESRLTQLWLRELLEKRGHSGRIAIFNGTNSDAESKACYERWIDADPDRRQLPREIGVREAIVERFRTEADILIATEAAAEGLNLQFCNMVVNYDLPWNPQRVEQRIGRCHRYGQLHDVIVVNLVDQRNPVDLRVHELLEKKFNLFDGVFGASDTPLGEVTSGCELERAIVDILRRCRTEVEIKGAFDRLESRLDDAGRARKAEVRRDILDNFHPDLVERLLGLEEDTRREVSELDRRLARTLVAACGPARKDRISDGIFRVASYPGDIAELAPDLEAGLLAVGARKRDPSVRCQQVTLDHPLTRAVVALRRGGDPTSVEPFVLRAPSLRASKLLGLADGTRGWWEVVRVQLPGPRAEVGVIHLVVIANDAGECEVLSESAVAEISGWETGDWCDADADADAGGAGPTFPAELFAAATAERVRVHEEACRRAGLKRLHDEFSRSDRYASEKLMQVEDQLAQVRRELPQLRAAHDRAVAEGDLEAEDSARRLLERLEDRLVLLRRDRVRLEEEQIRAGESLRARRKAELAASAQSQVLLRGHFRVRR